ncbi:MAG: GNAT family N-acetyltransferase [Bacteroidetes bacterium]|nr:MAG: GNAT family N-acetyltransferase [Bacteroidota bacterium]
MEFAEHLELMQRSIAALSDTVYTEAEKAAWIASIAQSNLPERLSQQFVMEVTDEDQKMIGFASFTEGEIDLLYIDAAHQRQGVGHELLEDLELYARQEAWPSISTFASKALFPLCIKHGYQVIETQDISLGDQVLRRFHVSKPLHNEHHISRFFMETDRLYLREMLSIDAENFYRLNADPEVMKHTGDTPFADVEASRQFLENYDPYSEEGMGRFTVIRKEDGQTLGWCGLRVMPDGDVDLGFRLDQAFWRQGYATEASIACLEWGKYSLELESIIGRCHPNNIASRKTLEKVGMQFEKESTDESGEPMLVYRIRL